MNTTLATLTTMVAAGNAHKFNAELFLILATIMLALVTTALTWVSYKLYKVTAQEASKLANNSVDSMEQVALTALKSTERHRLTRRGRY